jgi:tRNA-specific 2-thiouridylase
LKKRALAVFSGGLDSILAVKVIEDAGADVIGINFTTPFFDSKIAEKYADMIGLKLIIKDIYKRHIEVVKNPKFGYGKNMNPCIDCHALMFKIAYEMLSELKCDFLISGEVLNERPKSQNKVALKTVAKHSTVEDLLIRPLSAKLLEPTLPEREGWVDREKLLAISGKGRKPQLELAKKYNITEFPTPAGGCLLTDIGFSKRLKWAFNNEIYNERELKILKYGRHFLIDGFHTIIGRIKDENSIIENLASEEDIIGHLENRPSPSVLIVNGKKAKDELLKKIAALTLRYSKFRNEENIPVRLGEKVFIVSKAENENNFERII